jgi:hypothetical protein
VILEHSVLGLHTCLVPVFLSFPLLSCIPCLGSALQYTPLRLLSAFIYLVCITSTSILASLRCTCFVIARQISYSLSTFRANPTTVHVGHYSQPTITGSSWQQHYSGYRMYVYLVLYQLGYLILGSQRWVLLLIGWISVVAATSQHLLTSEIK